jgi:hypothetical protein
MSRPPIKARRPRLRWYLQVLRLHLARLLLLPPRERASRAFALLAAVAALGSLVAWEALKDAPAPAVDGLEVQLAWVNFVIQIVVMIAAALISYALRPKPKDPEVATANVPVAEDGKGIVRIYGTVWIDDSIVLGFKQLGTIPIKAKGGKK